MSALARHRSPPVAALLLAAAASAGAATPSNELLSAVRTQAVVSVIVEIDAAAVDAAAATRRAGLPRRVDDVASLATRAAGYRARKDSVFAGLQRPDIETVIDYSQLPQRSLRVRGEAALRALAARPGVRAVYADREHRAVLAESLPLIGQPLVAAEGYGGTGATVAVRAETCRPPPPSRASPAMRPWPCWARPNLSAAAVTPPSTETGASARAVALGCDGGRAWEYQSRRRRHSIRGAGHLRCAGLRCLKQITPCA